MTNVSEDPRLHPEVSGPWNARLIVDDVCSGTAGATCQFEFADIIDQVLVPKGAARIIWHATHGDRQSFFPCILSSKSAGPATWSELKPVYDLYPGRSSPPIDFDDEDTVTALLGAPFADWRRWDCFITDVVADGVYEQKLVDVATASGFTPMVSAEFRCPYIQLPDNWHSLFDNYAKKFRYNIRHSEKLLRECGALELRCFTDSGDVDVFLNDYLSVERHSWKQKAGTSISRNPKQQEFHSRLAPVAASKGLFRGYILYLDETAIAHIYGLYNSGTYYCLKLSYAESHKKYSPGIVITAMAIKDLIDNSARIWDFGGLTEDYKKRWTKDAYVVRTYVFFSRTLKGRLLRLRRKVRDLRRR